MKAVFGGAVKKPLMTKVSMRHLNEIVRERNQYSRDALEAWQDFINLKGRMDTELGKVTKRNNFLVEELETLKQQVRCLVFHRRNHMLIFLSSSNTKLSMKRSPKKPQTSRLRLRTTSARTDASLVLLTNRRTTLSDSTLVWRVPRSSVTMLSRR
jgi:hypothetical protein